MAQGIEIGVVAQGPTPKKAHTVLVETLTDYIACAERLIQAGETVSPIPALLGWRLRLALWYAGATWARWRGHSPRIRYAEDSIPGSTV